jgi:hypothetical protein
MEVDQSSNLLKAFAITAILGTASNPHHNSKTYVSHSRQFQNLNDVIPIHSGRGKRVLAVQKGQVC